jgi:hypothetical protein
MNRAKVMDRFRSIHGCEPDSAAVVGSGGYVVRGCGVESHFSCFDTGGYDNNNHGLIAGLMDVAVEVSDDVCIHEYSRGEYRSTYQQTPTLSLDTTKSGKEKIEATFLLGEGLLVIAGIPAEFGDQVGCIYKPLTDVALPPRCGVRFWADGNSIAPAKIMHSGGKTEPTIQFILRPRDISEMYRSDRVVGSLCELPVQFTANQRELLREFLVRFEQQALQSTVSPPPA